ncbi:MAG: oxidoreductase [Micavibrio aeruginosavorus]|uniref:Oxidoreductase n=1 Tax=Micavibrio aeruginosavorus TaxID=349221 RepID=A0A2W4ZL03_9BACT|nr:MAG: oxidoreductase [Micavibrio aeruginosavorus]
MKARIYRPSKNTMQSGLGRTQKWVLEVEAETPRAPEPLMGWTASGDTTNQIRLRFDSREQAIAYAEDKGIEYTVDVAHDRKIKPQNYADNFRYIPPKENATS